VAKELFHVDKQTEGLTDQTKLNCPFSQ